MAGTKVKIAAGHEGNREKVCAPCGRKILVKDKRKLNYVQIDIIKEHIDYDFDIENPVFPVGDKKHKGLCFLSPAFCNNSSLAI